MTAAFLRGSHSGRALCAAAVALLLCAGNASAAVVTWSSTSSNDWNTAANWSPAQVPTTGDNVTFNTSATPPTVNGSAFVGINTGGAVSIGSINSTDYALTLGALGVETLQITAGVTAPAPPTSGPASPLVFQLPVTAGSNGGASQNWGGVIQSSTSLNIASNVVITSGATTVTPETGVTFTIYSPTSYGNIYVDTTASAGFTVGQSGTNSYLSIAFGATFSITEPITFTLVADNTTNHNPLTNVFQYATWDVDQFPALPEGYAWDDTNLANGTLSIVAVPEPAALALVGCGLGLLFIRRRNRLAKK